MYLLKICNRYRCILFIMVVFNQSDCYYVDVQLNALCLGNGFRVLRNSTRRRGIKILFYIALPCNLFRSPLEPKCQRMSVIGG